MKKGPFKLKYTDGKKASPAKAFDVTDPKNFPNLNDMGEVRAWREKKNKRASHYKGKRSPAKTTDFNQWSDEAKKQYMDKIRPHARKKYGDRVADKYFGGSNTKKASNYKGRR